METNIKTKDLEIIRYERKGKARAYLDVRTSGKVERAGYIDLESGEIVAEHSYTPQAIRVILAMSGLSVAAIVRRMSSMPPGC